MIVKIKNEKNCWSYFEGDNIIQHRITYEEIKDDYMDSQTLHFLSNEIDYSIKDNLEKIPIIRLCIQNENKVIGRIITNRVMYLLNDNGKTIDKLI